MKNLLKYNIVKIELNYSYEYYGLVLLKKGKPMNKIEAELDAIEKTDLVRQFHLDNGFEKDESYYKSFKFQMMEQNDKGVKRVSEHFFKDHNGQNIKTWKN